MASISEGQVSTGLVNSMSLLVLFASLGDKSLVPTQFDSAVITLEKDSLGEGCYSLYRSSTVVV